ncbi:MAG: tetratricopeptide repeat protein, partial [Oscillibacter sp.]|nr:tetratricopeptide repeat protein [Oscillibacter sp.]
EYLSLLAELYFNYNQDKKGLQILERLLKADPENGFVHFYLADYYRSKKQQQLADKHTRCALVSDQIENGYKIQYILRLVLNPDTTLVSDAELDSYMELLMQKYSDDLSIRALHSDFLKKDNKLSEAKTELEYILSKDQNNYLIWEELLLLCNEISDTVCLKNRSIEAIKYFPEQPLPYVFAGISFMMQDNFKEALPFLRKGVVLTDDKMALKSQFYAYLADCYYSLDSVQEAFDMFDKVLEINPNNILVLNNYAYYLSLRNENLSLAEKMSSKAVSMESDNPTYLDTYAWVLYMRGDYSQAKFYIKLAIEKSKEPSGVLYEHYGDILYRGGEKEQAMEMWKKALELGTDHESELKRKIKSGILPE